MTPAFDKDPKCLLMRQGNFVTGFYPEDVQADLDNSVGSLRLPAEERG